MNVINLNLPEKYFRKDRHNRLEARIARFELHKGDIIRFNEIHRNKKLTGRFFDRAVKDFHKIHKATKYWMKKDLTKYGLYVLELAEPRKSQII